MLIQQLLPEFIEQCFTQIMSQNSLSIRAPGGKSQNTDQLNKTAYPSEHPEASQRTPIK